MNANELLYDEQMRHWGAVIGPYNVFVLEDESDPAMWALHIDSPEREWETLVPVRRGHSIPEHCRCLQNYLSDLESLCVSGV